MRVDNIKIIGRDSANNVRGKSLNLTEDVITIMPPVWCRDLRIELLTVERANKIDTVDLSIYKGLGMSVAPAPLR